MLSRLSIHILNYYLNVAEDEVNLATSKQELIDVIDQHISNTVSRLEMGNLTVHDTEDNSVTGELSDVILDFVEEQVDSVEIAGILWEKMNR